MKILYAYLDPRKSGKWETTNYCFFFEPFYVGKGKQSRQFDHLKDSRRSHKVHKIQEIISEGLTPFIIILKDDLIDKNVSVELETKLIKDLGTRSVIEGVKRGPLTNLRLYGKRGFISAETKLKMSTSKKGKTFSDEHKAKLSLAAKGRKWSLTRKPNPPLSLEARIKISERQLGRIKSPSECANISKAQRGRIISPEHRKKLSIACKGRSSPNTRDWKIEFKNGDLIIIKNLVTWCKENGIIPNSLRNTLSSGKFHKGVKLLKM
jgi:hypothetical protein